ncbi:hypothetical protein BV898_02977 [Hypsibius exemplaris]|uniref:Uncharacterized protein n=1 Tax=Hypsibius exemplaris TaxID=2072580 RepID=A0A1W0X773_HYPEX|nr:hypothetical protein BV898_02977 [Hypsibius exemplaris]
MTDRDSHTQTEDLFGDLPQTVDDGPISAYESPSLRTRGSHSVSLDRDRDSRSRSSSTSEQENATSEDPSSPGPSRVPMAWRYRQAHAQTVESTTVFRGGDPAYHPLHASTFNPHRSRDYFKTASAIRCMQYPGPSGTPGKFTKTVFPRNGPHKEGFRTLPARRANVVVPAVPGLTTSFYRLPKPNIPRSVSGVGGGTIPPLSPRSERRAETLSVASQFCPGMEHDLVDYAAVGNYPRLPYPPPGSTAMEPQWRPPGFIPVSMLPPPLFPVGGGGGSVVHGPISVLANYSPEPKEKCGTVCCSGGFIVLWLIIAVIAIGVIVGVAVIFGRRNILT